MADFSAPSFSLGLDLEEEEEEPPLPSHTPREKTRFPITVEEGGGFDSEETLDPDQEEEEEEEPPFPNTSREKFQSPTKEEEEEEGGFESVVTLSPDKEEGPLPLPVLKRLRRGPLPVPAVVKGNIYLVDDIHEFSSQEEEHRRPGRVKDDKEVDESKRGGQHAQYAMRNDRRAFQPNSSQGEGLWKDFVPKENICLATPALDEFCEDYFTPAKYQKVGHHRENERSLNSSILVEPHDSVNVIEDYYQQKYLYVTPDNNWELPQSQPPAYKYFYHNDARIRSLIRERLCFFVPIGEVNGKGTQQFGAENLDYMSQFGLTKSASQECRTCEKGYEGSSKTRDKRSHSSLKEASDATGSWVNPRGNASEPKHASKRRVSAVAGRSGNWFTSEKGKKVYINKDGKELTGQIAYRHYRKESCTAGGFRKGKKKAVKKRSKRK